jgi:hypothetical protein
MLKKISISLLIMSLLSASTFANTLNSLDDKDNLDFDVKEFEGKNTKEFFKNIQIKGENSEVISIPVCLNKNYLLYTYQNKITIVAFSYGVNGSKIGHKMKKTETLIDVKLLSNMNQFC